jgi:hypothetical protein
MGLWILLAVCGLAVVALAARGLLAPKARAAASAPMPKGPTKEQVRERQEHIALTERALELARKERAAAPPATTAASPAPGSSSAPAAPASVRTSSAAAPKAEAPAAATPAAPATKPAAASGLDEMRADITSAFE